MPLDGGTSDLQADFELLEAIGAHVENLIDELLARGAIQKTLRHWLSGRVASLGDEVTQARLMALAADLDLFTPSASGRTAVDRYVEREGPKAPEGRAALAALAAAGLRLVRVSDREGPETVWVDDLVTGERLCVLDARLSPLAVGAATAMRLCPLPSGRFALISPLYMIDEAMLAEAMTFARGGRPLGAGHRCAANLYRAVARRGLMPMPELMETVFEIDDGLPEDFTEVERLGVRWLRAGGADADADAAGDLAAAARRLASADNLVDACGLVGNSDLMQKTRAVFERIAEVQVETLVARSRAIGDEACEDLRLADEAIARFMARKKINPAARELLDRLRARWDGAPTAAGKAAGALLEPGPDSGA